ncbi:group II intron reverse transcriptase/maturase [Clostridium sp. AUH-JLR23]|uniref:group II intron reverse transcriptase/maturase n=1 Tax=Clostridium sp. AUH-JLR23 TaxID=1505062 RepID=UPI0035671A96
MKDTQDKIGYCQLSLGLLYEDSTEYDNNGEVYPVSKQEISHMKNTNRFVVHEKLLEAIVEDANIEKAIQRVVSNKGSGGVDKMQVAEVRTHFAQHWSYLKKLIMEGHYSPQAVKRVEIPKDNGKKRGLGIPTVTDRVIQQAIVQILTPIFEPLFNENSYGFRPRRSAHQAVKRVVDYANEGYRYTVDLDLEKYFDTVNHSRLIQILSQTIKDGRVISLIHKYLNAGVVVKHKFEETTKGVPQGGPLSPLLSNVYLNEFDKEMERRGNRFVRYADDCVILFKSERSAMRVKETVTRYLEENLFVKVNQEKTKVAYITGVKFLGFGFYIEKSGNVRITVHKKSKEKMKRRIKEITKRNRPISSKELAQELKLYITGWINYYRIADMRGYLGKVDSWIRRRIRMIYWKRWKLVRTRYRNLQKLGIDRNKAWEWANTRKSYWHIANSFILSRTLTNERLKRFGFVSALDYYNSINL